MADNKKINLGASNDLEIYHDGAKSVVRDVGLAIYFWGELT